MSSVAGDSGIPLAQALGIEPGMRVALLHAPEGFDRALAPLPAAVRLQHGLRRHDRVDLMVGFVTERAHLASNMPWLVDTLAPAGAFWVAWPEPTSGVETDMTEDVVRAVALPLGWVGTRVCAIDATWSALELVQREEVGATER